MLASQENVYLTILHALTVSNESEKARSTPVSTVLRKSVTSFIINIFLIQKTLSKLKSGKWCGHFFFLQFLRLRSRRMELANIASE